MITKEEVISVGKFQKTHALKGELNMISEIDPQYFLEGNPIIIDTDGILVPYYVESIRPKGSTSFLVKLENIDTEDEASEFVNREINILKKDAEEWIEDDVIDSDTLIGFKIIDFETREEIGEITGIEDSTSNILFYVKPLDGEEIFIPASEDLIEEINEDDRVIIMKLPEGLLEMN